MLDRSWERWRSLLANERLPAAIVDLDAFERNADRVLAMLPPRLTLRIATKSLRVPGLIHALLQRGGGRFVGCMTWSAHETAWLAAAGFHDLLLAYPPSRADEAAALAAAARATTVRVVVDDRAQASLLSAAAVQAGVKLGICVDVDASLRMWGGAAHLGVRRSPIRDAAAAAALGRAVRGMPGLRLDGMMSYEAQVSSLVDVVAGKPWMDRAHAWVKRRSVPVVRARRAEVAAALAEGGALAVVNGGGTGSLRSTGEDPTVTEVTAGSGFFLPHLFDGFADLALEPALALAVAVSRRSDPDYVTCAGGGYIASGASGADRSPVVISPPGLSPIAMEGFGEVQTPLRVSPGAVAPAIGDPVILRPAKAGEPLERFAEVVLVRGDRVVGREATLRGLGLCFG